MKDSNFDEHPPSLISTSSLQSYGRKTSMSCWELRQLLHITPKYYSSSTDVLVNKIQWYFTKSTNLRIKGEMNINLQCFKNVWMYKNSFFDYPFRLVFICNVFMSMVNWKFLTLFKWRIAISTFSLQFQCINSFNLVFCTNWSVCWKPDIKLIQAFNMFHP